MTPLPPKSPLFPYTTLFRSKYPEVRFLSIGEPNYGKAMKTGILESLGEFVICVEIDLCDTDFHKHALDRKSTRLNSSHRCISYAVFCLKKKKKTKRGEIQTS